VTTALDLSAYTRLAERDHGLCVVSTARADGSVQSSLVNAGVLAHPGSGEPVVGLVVRGDARKLANLRRRPRATLVAHAGYEWVAVEGPVDLVGPDDPLPGVDGEGLRLLLRAVFVAAGGTHEDWDEFDRVMRGERRAAVLVRPTRVYSNG
jgi:PPOX class probable F420-dependent enzyme